MNLKFDTINPGLPVETKDGPGIFQAYKPNQFKEQNIKVLLNGQKVARWFKEKHVTPIKADIIR